MKYHLLIKKKINYFSLPGIILSRCYMTRKRISVDDKRHSPEIFKKPLGAFVTLKIDGSLRGCIGRFISSDPLYEVVLESSQSSAFEDPRFAPLTKEELAKTDIEITVLGPLIKDKRH